MPMRAGRMRTRVEVQTSVLARNDYGEEEQAWLTSESRWAYVQPVSGAEVSSGDQQEARVTHLVQMRYWADVTPQYRLKIGDRILNIDSVRNLDSRNAEMELACIEVVQ